MTEYGYFDKPSAERIGKVVKHVERQIPKTNLKYNRGNSAVKSDSKFKAVLTEVDTSNGRYGYRKIKPQDESEFSLQESPFIQFADWGEAAKDDSTGYAYEQTGSIDCCLWDVVTIEGNGLQDYYTFEYKPLKKWVKNIDAIPAVDDTSDEKFTAAICNVYQFTQNSTYEIQSSVTADPVIRLKAYNPSFTEIPADTFLMVCFLAGRWWVDLQRCE